MSIYNYKDTALYYKIEGEGIPVLLIHGWGIDHRYLTGCMEPVFRSVQMNYARYYVDLPGMGRSIPGEVKDTNDILNVLISFIHDIFKDQPFLLAGNSYGGMLSRLIALKLPELVLGMILICPSTRNEHPVIPECTVYEKDDALLASLDAHALAHFTSLNVHLTKEAWHTYAKDIYPAVLESDTNTFLNSILDGNLKKDMAVLLSAQIFTKPVLILTGRSDCCVGYMDQIQWLKNYPCASYLALWAAGHNLSMDEPEMFFHIVTDWINCYIKY